ADRGHPGIISIQGSLERLQFSETAAQVGISFPEPRPMNFILFFGGQVSRDGTDSDAVAILDAVPEVIGFWKQEPGIEEEDIDARIDRDCQINEGDAFGAKSCRNRHALAKTAERPVEGFRGPGPFQDFRSPANSGWIVFLRVRFKYRLRCDGGGREVDG